MRQSPPSPNSLQRILNLRSYMTTPIKLPHHLDANQLTCRAVIETPKGARSKFDYDPDSGLFLLAGLVPAGMAFPLSFGFIPSTQAEDGDPLDVARRDDTSCFACLRSSFRCHRG